MTDTDKTRYSLHPHIRDGSLMVREQAVEYGIESLTDTELLMLMLGSGRKGMPVTRLAEKVLQILKTTDRSELQTRLNKLSGMGIGKTTAVLAALECGRRFTGRQEVRIRTPRDLVPIVQAYALESQEHFICISLNGAHELLKIQVISVGTINRSLIHPREIFAEPIRCRAAAIILAHNHPSERAEPSQQDIDATRRIFEASEIIGIQLLDHIIITKSGYFSFRENTDIFLRPEE